MKPAQGELGKFSCFWSQQASLEAYHTLPENMAFYLTILFLLKTQREDIRTNQFSRISHL